MGFEMRNRPEGWQLEPELEEDELDDVREVAPGKVPRTARLGRRPRGSSPPPAPVSRPVQRKAASPLTALIGNGMRPDLHPVAPASGGRPLPASVLALVEAVFSADLSRVRVHEGPQAAAMGALAYTQGTDIHMQPGLYDPHSERGLELLGHELAHVVQQAAGYVANREGVVEDTSMERQADAMGARVVEASRGEVDVAPDSAPRVRPTPTAGAVQRRRVPEASDLRTIIPSGGANADAHLEGLRRVIERAASEMSDDEKIQAVERALGGFSMDNLTAFGALSEAEQLTRLAAAIHHVRPDLVQGDPALIDVGARNATDTANIATLVGNANNIFDALTGGSHDTSIGQVFGTGNVAAAKAKYAAAKTRMNYLHGTDHIVTDRSGYNREVGLGGLTNSNQIMVSPSTIDNPSDHESVVTMIHESMHAGNDDVSDHGYIHQPSFLELAEDVKLCNAAHFEVPARRILGADPTFAGQTFVPAGSSSGGVSAPPLSHTQQAIRGASEEFRKAWTVGLNLHSMWVRIHRTPSEWNTFDLDSYGAAPGLHWSDAMPFWSKVQKLTVHQKVSIAPAGGADTAPVSLIDISLSEGLTRLLARCMSRIPRTEEEANQLLLAHASMFEYVDACLDVDVYRDLLLKFIIQHQVGELTGTPERDVRVVKQMAAVNGSYADYLQDRDPADFPD